MHDVQSTYAKEKENEKALLEDLEEMALEFLQL